jgi:hypothetical protein
MIWNKWAIYSIAYSSSSQVCVSWSVEVTVLSICWCYWQLTIQNVRYSHCARSYNQSNNKCTQWNTIKYISWHLSNSYMFLHCSAVLRGSSRTKEYKSKALIQALLERLNYWHSLLHTLYCTSITFGGCVRNWNVLNMKYRVLCFVDRASLYNLVNKVNLVHNLFLLYLSLVYLSISTCFGRLCAHHQEKQLCLCDTWYLFFCVDECLLCIPSGMHNRQFVIRCSSLFHLRTETHFFRNIAFCPRYQTVGKP